MDCKLPATLAFDHPTINAIASHLDQDLIGALTAQGFFRRRGRLPFYGMRGREAKLTFDEFQVMSLLDADLPYRFS